LMRIGYPGQRKDTNRYLLTASCQNGKWREDVDSIGRVALLAAVFLYCFTERALWLPAATAGGIPVKRKFPMAPKPAGIRYCVRMGPAEIGRRVRLQPAGIGCGLYFQPAGIGCGLYLEPAGIL
ncbi:MAG: hypothetical protein ACRD4Y_13355, partial [Candidatus Acidiferrales bacterium]